MGKMSKEDERFLQSHGIPVVATFDASGLAAGEWKAAMRAEGKLIAYGVSCLRGHSLKTRSGSCIRCNTANISFALRSHRDGFVYLARSSSAKLLKVGFSARDPFGRIEVANYEGYGGASDWRVRTVVESSSAGRFEIDLHAALSGWSAPQGWIRNGALREAREIYTCSLATARNRLSILLAHDPEATLEHFRG